MNQNKDNEKIILVLDTSWLMEIGNKVFIESQNKKNCNINEKNCRISLDKVANNGTKWDLMGFYGIQKKSEFGEIA